jgi:hypothetical protein
MGVVVLFVSWQRGGTVLGGLKRTLEFVLSAFGVLQVIIQIGRATQPGLPLLLVRMYNALLLLQLDGITLHPNCMDAPPFQQEIVEMALSLSLMVALSALFLNSRCCCRCLSCGIGEQATGRSPRHGVSAKTEADGLKHSGVVEMVDKHRQRKDAGTGKTTGTCCVHCGRGVDVIKPFLRRIVITLLTLLYATVANVALSLLPCDPQFLRVADYLQLSMDGATLRSQLGIGLSDVASACLDVNCERRSPWYDRTISVSVLTSNPAFVCYESSHFTAALLAWTCLVAYAIGYPLFSFLLLRRRISQIMMRGPLRHHYEMALTKDHMRRQAWTTAGGNACTRCWRRLCARVCFLGSRYSPSGPAAISVHGLRACCASVCSSVGPLDSEEVVALSSTAAATEAFARTIAQLSAGLNQTVDSSSAMSMHRPQPPKAALPVLMHEPGAKSSAVAPAATGRLSAVRLLASPRVRLSGAKTGTSDAVAGSLESLNYARRKRGIVAPRSPGIGAALAGASGLTLSSGSSPQTPPAASPLPPTRGKLLTSRVRLSTVRATSGNPMHAVPRHGLASASQTGGTPTLPVAATNDVAEANSHRIRGDRGATVITANALIDGNPSITRNPTLSPFTVSDYRPSRYWMLQEEMALMLALGLLAAFWPSNSDPMWCAGLLALTVVAICVEAGVVIAQKPFTPEAQWMLPVRVATVLLACVSALLNYVNAINPLPAAAGAADGSRSGESTATERPVVVIALSYLTFGCSLLLAVVLVLAFLSSLWHGARKEEAVRQLVAAAERINDDRLSVLRDALTRVGGTSQDTVIRPAESDSARPAARQQRGADDSGLPGGRMSFGTQASRAGRQERRPLQRLQPPAPGQ